jgi:catechol 2,3-dioxygenase-like lactoylglutathione lyase family enzyme
MKFIPRQFHFEGFANQYALDVNEQNERRRHMRKRIDSTSTIFAAAAILFSIAAASDQSYLDKGDIQMTVVSVRYIVDDVDAAIAFYTKHLDFRVDLHPAPGFASLSRGNLRLLLNAPGAGGAGQAMPDGRKPAPGGWNRIMLEVEDLVAKVETLRTAGLHFRNDIVIGNGGKQILLDDPAGNCIELFEPLRK